MPSKETLCTHCIHRKVCCFKNVYLDVIKAIDNVEVRHNPIDGKEYDQIIKVTDITWLQPIVPICVNYQENKPSPKNTFDVGIRLL